MTADMESDTVAQGLWFAISKHIMDPAFINLLMQYLSRNKNEEENAITGALLTKLLNKYMQENAPKETTKSKKGDSKEKSAIAFFRGGLFYKINKNELKPFKMQPKNSEQTFDNSLNFEEQITQEVQIFQTRQLENEVCSLFRETFFSAEGSLREKLSTVYLAMEKFLFEHNI
jgi:hypothetical protein